MAENSYLKAYSCDGPFLQFASQFLGEIAATPGIIELIMVFYDSTLRQFLHICSNSEVHRSPCGQKTKINI